MTGFFTKHNTELKWITPFRANVSINQYHTTGLFLPTENIRKLEVFLMFSGGIERDQWIILESIETNENIGRKLVNPV